MTAYLVHTDDRAPLPGSAFSTFNASDPARTWALASATLAAGRQVTCYRIEPAAGDSGQRAWAKITFEQLAAAAGR